MARRKPIVAPQPPVTDEHLAALRAVIQSCQQTEQECERCRQCNIDVNEEAVANAQQAEMAQKIIDAYFPGQS